MFLVVTVTVFTLVAFAANSLLCRMALGGDLIDPASFTTIRLVSGAAILVPLARLTREEKGVRAGIGTSSTGSWISGFALFSYAIAFSVAYLSLETGMGALILFGTVQVTMILAALRSGERLGLIQWMGLALAVAGLTYLVSPGLSAPDPLGAILNGGGRSVVGCVFASRTGGRRPRWR